MGGLFETICIGSSTEGASPPEIMNWMHADLQIEVEKLHLIDDLKTHDWYAQGSIFLVQSARSFFQSLLESHQFPLLVAYTGDL